ncbi:MAG: hypothetical protein WBA46_12350 [Thermomicrobiales bacterium]
MDPNRFDSLTRAFSSRFSRRSAVRAGGAGVAAALAVSVGLGPTRTLAAQTGTPYSTIRKYVLTGPTDAAVQALNSGYLPQLQQQAGFLAYTVVTSPPNTLTTVAVFDSQADFTAAEQNLGAWVSQNLASLLPAATENTQGNAVIFALNTNTICGSGPAPTAVPSPTPVPASPEACTGIGCLCNGGVQNACDDGLVCCQSQMGGGSIPGGQGMCAAADACGGEATPVT